MYVRLGTQTLSESSQLVAQQIGSGGAGRSAGKMSSTPELSVPDPFHLSALIADKSGAAALHLFESFGHECGEGWGSASIEAPVDQPAMELSLPMWPAQLSYDGHKVPTSRVARVKRHVTSASAATFWDAASYQLGGGSEFYQAISAAVRNRAIEVNVAWSGGTKCALRFEVTDDPTTDNAALLT